MLFLSPISLLSNTCLNFNRFENIVAKLLRRNQSRGRFAADKAKRVDGTSTSAEATKKNAPYGRSGQGDVCEEQAQGNGETPVRVMRHQARTRQGGGIPPTKHRDANGGCSAREESSFSPKRETSMRCLDPAPEGAKRGHGRDLAERTEAGGGELCRTRPRSRICIRRAGRRTHKSTALHREHGCPDRDRTLKGKHTSTAQCGTLPCA